MTDEAEEYGEFPLKSFLHMEMGGGAPGTGVATVDIGPEHLLLGLVREGEGIAAGVLESLGVNLDKVRHEVIRVLSQSSASGPSTAASEGKRGSGSKTPTVDQLGINLTEAARSGELEIVVEAWNDAGPAGVVALLELAQHGQDVLGLKLGQRHAADGRLEIAIDDAAVALCGPRPDGQRRQPGVEIVGGGQPPVDGQDAALRLP